MNNLLEIKGFKEFAEDKEMLFELIDGEFTECKNAGDLLGAAEWLSVSIPYRSPEELDRLFAQLVSFCASPFGVKFIPESIDDLISRIEEFSPEDLAPALIETAMRFKQKQIDLPQNQKDLSYRLQDQIISIFDVKPKRPSELCVTAAAKLETVKSSFLSAIGSFVSTQCDTAKVASIEIVKMAHILKKLSIPSEKPIISEIDILLGPSFRKFCESCEKQESKGIIRRVPNIRSQSKKSLSSKQYINSLLWHQSIYQISRHINKLVEEANVQSLAATKPSLELAVKEYKLNLKRINHDMTFSCRLVNKGEGRANNICMVPEIDKSQAKFRIIEPKGIFEIDSQSEQIITFELITKNITEQLTIPISWRSETITGLNHTDSDLISIKQQNVQPNWDDLLKDPPYKVNPVRKRENLYGRDAIIQTATTSCVRRYINLFVGAKTSRKNLHFTGIS